MMYKSVILTNKRIILSILLAITLLNYSIGMAQINSLFSDVKARQVGDVLTVLISESTSGSSISKNNSSTNAGIDISAKANANIVKSAPSIGGSGNIGTDYRGQNGAEQKEKLLGMVTVRIVEATESGMFKIEGERMMEVNGEQTLTRVEGYVRPRDISTNNVVYSYNIANAEITYRQDGITDSFLKPGDFSKIFAYALGGLMVVAAAGYIVFEN